MSISVLGAGAFGTALAISLARKARVTLWARNARNIHQERENKARLPGHPFPSALCITDDIQAACENDLLLIAIPTQKLGAFAAEYRRHLDHKTLVACCKGIELNTGLGPTRILMREVPTAQSGLLTGPSFANDIAQGLPTALVIACQDEATGAKTQKALTTATLRLYRTNDTFGAELGGALKNVIAIACGAAIGAGLGESARAALMTRGYAEIQRFAVHQGAEARTLAGLSGFGDLTLTCTSHQSRNYRLGQALGRGAAFDQTLTVEGAATAHAIHAQSQSIPLELPIMSAVAGLLKEQLNVKTAMQMLLDRPLRKE
ncbi:MAG: NAD(P)H-dependent glycerol-3-phosphate dehydrogenase [Pseudomonadota bacterium]